MTPYISVFFGLMLFVLFYGEIKCLSVHNPEKYSCVYINFVLWFLPSAEEHQSQLIECGGLPLIISLLTEDSNEEVRKAVTFILQTCKQASKHCDFNVVSHFTSISSYLFVVLTIIQVI